jgi:hypothetical protein
MSMLASRLLSPMMARPFLVLSGSTIQQPRFLSTSPRHRMTKLVMEPLLSLSLQENSSRKLKSSLCREFTHRLSSRDGDRLVMLPRRHLKKSPWITPLMKKLSRRT